MTDLKYNIITYSENYEEALLALERDSPQGKYIQLEMLRNSFHKRAALFDDHQIYLCVDKLDNLLGVVAVAEVKITINNESTKVGYFFDLRVGKKVRKHGIAKKLAIHAFQNFYVPKGISKVFTTLKKGNIAVLKSAKVFGMKLYDFSFSYITIPTFHRVKKEIRGGKPNNLVVTIPRNLKKLDSYLNIRTEELLIWRADLIYRLKIRKLHFLVKVYSLLKTAIGITNNVIEEGDELRFGILIYNNLPTRNAVNSLLNCLEQAGIGYLLVACVKNTDIYNFFKPIAINQYSYSICSTFNLNQTDFVDLDVRCL